MASDIAWNYDLFHSVTFYGHRESKMKTKNLLALIGTATLTSTMLCHVCIMLTPVPFQLGISCAFFNR